MEVRPLPNVFDVLHSLFSHSSLSNKFKRKLRQRRLVNQEFLVYQITLDMVTCPQFIVNHQLYKKRKNELLSKNSTFETSSTECKY